MAGQRHRWPDNPARLAAYLTGEAVPRSFRAFRCQKRAVVQQLAALFPVVDDSQHVGPYDKKELSPGVGFPEMRDRLIGIDDPFLAYFPVTDLESRVGADRPSQHVQAPDRGGDGGLFVGRGAGGNENDAVQPIGFARRFCQEEMSPMNGVKGAAEQGDSCPGHSLICPVPRTTYLVVVSSRAPIVPRACSLRVEIPISAPSPKTLPSCRRVEALWNTA